MPSPEKFEQVLHEFNVSNDIVERMYEGFEKMSLKAAKRRNPPFSVRR